MMWPFSEGGLMTSLFLTWLKSAGNAFLFHLFFEIPFCYNKMTVFQHFNSWKRQQGREHVPVALSPRANQTKVGHWANFTWWHYSCRVLQWSIPWSEGECRYLKSPVRKGDLSLARRVTGPLPQTPGWQIACPAFLAAAASSFLHIDLPLKQEYLLDTCRAAC